MECDRYPEPERPRPARVSGRVRTRAEGDEEVGRCWGAYGRRDQTRPMARALRGAGLESVYHS